MNPVVKVACKTVKNWSKFFRHARSCLSDPTILVVFDCPHHHWLCLPLSCINTRKIFDSVSPSPLITRVWERAWVFASLPPESAKSLNIFNCKYGFSVATSYDCPHHSSCIHFWAKPSFVCPHKLSKFWGKKSKSTTKVTLTSHQIFPSYMAKGRQINFELVN